jgi:hypothetical protein
MPLTNAEDHVLAFHAKQNDVFLIATDLIGKYGITDAAALKAIYERLADLQLLVANKGTVENIGGVIMPHYKYTITTKGAKIDS